MRKSVYTVVHVTAPSSLHTRPDRRMDASPLFDPQYLPVVLATLIGFSAIAALLLVPVYRFLEREEKVAEKWTPEELAERFKEARAAREGKGEEKEGKGKDGPTREDDEPENATAENRGQTAESRG